MLSERPREHLHGGADKVSRTRPLRWPSSLFAEGNRRVREAGVFSPARRYTFRMARYWFAASEIEIELAARGDAPVGIVDVGCERGITKAFCPERPRTRWIGLDMDTGSDELALAGYDEVHSCNFDHRLPLPDGSADIVVCLHVVEHLENPEATLRDMSRTLKPNGLLVAAAPILPGVLARVREAALRRERRNGARSYGAHVNALSVARWRSLAAAAGLTVQGIWGGHFLRWSAGPFEDFAWWVRLNQLWGVLTPSLGREGFVLARKPLNGCPLESEGMLQQCSGESNRKEPK